MSNLHEYHVSLRVKGEDLVPPEITALLGVEPTLCYRKGDSLRAGKGKTRTARFAMWIRDERGGEPRTLAETIDGLLDKFPDDTAVWRELTRRFEVDLFCGVFMQGFNEGFEIPPRLAARVAERGLTIGFDLYGPGRDHRPGDVPHENPRYDDDHGADQGTD